MRFSNESFYETLKDKLERVRMHGGYFSALCPLHNDHTPSLLVYPNGWKCMACNKSGSLSQLCNTLSKKRKFSSKFLSDLPSTAINPKPFSMPPEELAWLAHDSLCAFPQQGHYLQQRKVSNQIDIAHLGFWDGFYSFPAFGETDNFLSLPMRAGPVAEKRLGLRYLPCAYALYVPSWPNFLRSKHVYIVYGIFDALSLAELGIPVCASTIGKHFAPEWLEMYRDKTFSVVPDLGEEANARHLLSYLGWRGKKVVQLNYPEGCHDINDMHVQGHEKYLLSQL